MRSETKRQNFNVTPEQDADLLRLRDGLGVSSVKDAILRAAQIVTVLTRQTQRGGTLYIQTATGENQRLVIPELELAFGEEWLFLTARPHPWRRQLFLKGRKLPAATVWTDWRVNGGTEAEAAANWDIPLAAAQECIRYGETNQDLLRLEAEEEHQRLSDVDVLVSPNTSRRPR